MEDEQITPRLRRGERVDQRRLFIVVFVAVLGVALASSMVSVRSTSAGTPCGNGIVDVGEDCDPSSPSGAMCLPGEVCTNCQCTTCGNGVVDPGEDCDPTSPSGAFACPSGQTCTPTCACVPGTTTSTVAATTTTVAVTTTVTSTTAVTSTTEINHFQCYELRKQNEPTHVVTVQDQFHSATGVTLSKPNRLCAPTNKRGEDPTAPSDPGHLKAYQDKHTGPKVANQTIVNQFGTVQLDVSKPSFLLVPASKSLTATPPAPLTPPTPDHFQCYKVKRSKGAAKFTRVAGVTGQDQFGPYSVDLLRPRWLCAPANKSGEDPTAPAHPEHLLCYKTRNNTAFAQRTATLNDQFGIENVNIIRRIELCVPSLKNPGGTTTTSTTPVTTTSSSTVTTSSSSTVTTSSSSTITTSSTTTVTTSSSTTSTTLYGSPARAFLDVVRSLLD
jgi:hypothetical protein